MFKQILIILYGMVLLTTFVDGLSLFKRNDDFNENLPFDDNQSFDSMGTFQQYPGRGPSNQQYPGRGPSNQQSPGRGPGNQQTFQQEMLNAHNAYRRCHGVADLILDSSLNAEAQAYAQHLADTRSFAHSSPGERSDSGENLYMEGGSGNVNGKTPTDAWYNEVASYNFDRGSFSGATGHFTQLVWKGSQRLGVGIAYAGGSAYIVARYSPAGNFMGRFQENVFPRQC